MVRTTNDANICLSIASVLMSLGTQSALCFVLLFSIIRYMYMGGERFSLVRQWQRRRQKLTETHTCQTRIILSNRTAVISTNIERMWRKKRGHKAFQPLIDTHKWIYVFCRNSENFIRSPVRWVLSLIFLSLSLASKNRNIATSDIHHQLNFGTINNLRSLLSSRKSLDARSRWEIHYSKRACWKHTTSQSTTI